MGFSRPRSSWNPCDSPRPSNQASHRIEGVTAAPGRVAELVVNGVAQAERDLEFHSARHSRSALADTSVSNVSSKNRRTRTTKRLSAVHTAGMSTVMMSIPGSTTSGASSFVRIETSRDASIRLRVRRRIKCVTRSCVVLALSGFPILRPTLLSSAATWFGMCSALQCATPPSARSSTRRR